MFVLQDTVRVYSRCNFTEKNCMSEAMVFCRCRYRCHLTPRDVVNEDKDSEPELKCHAFMYHNSVDASEFGRYLTSQAVREVDFRK